MYVRTFSVAKCFPGLHHIGIHNRYLNWHISLIYPCQYSSDQDFSSESRQLSRLAFCDLTMLPLLVYWRGIVKLESPMPQRQGKKFNFVTTQISLKIATVTLGKMLWSYWKNRIESFYMINERNYFCHIKLVTPVPLKKLT